MDYKYNQSQKRDKIPLSHSPKFDNQLGYSNTLFPPIDSMRPDAHNFLNDDLPNFGSSNPPHHNQSQRLTHASQSLAVNGDFHQIDQQQSFLLSQNIGGSYHPYDNYNNGDSHPGNIHNNGGISPYNQDQMRGHSQSNFMNPSQANHRMSQPNFIHSGINNHYNANNNIPNFDNQNSVLKGQFSDFSWKSDDDEDYSLNEDLELNQKIYKKDLRPFKFQIPKTEVNDLLRDNIKNTNNYSIDSILDSGVNYYNNTQANLKKRKLGERITPISSNGVSVTNIANNTNNSSMINQQKRLKISSGAGITSTTGQLSSYQGRPNNNDQSFANNSNFDNIFLGPNDSQPPVQQFGSQMQYRPNMQNNYYYNFNNNFGPQTLDNCGSQVQSSNHQQKPNVQTKSIEIQVTPEKLIDEDSYDKNSKLKKKRRRQRKQKSNEKNQDSKNDSNSKNNKQSDYLQYYDQYAALYGQAQPYNLASQGRFPYMPSPYYQPNPYMMHGYYQGFQPMPPFQQTLKNPIIPQNDNNTNLTNDDLKFKEHIRDYLRTMFYPFQNDQLKELVSQIDIYVQILYQMLLLGKKKQNSLNIDITGASKDNLSNDKLNYQIYSLLYDFQSKKEQTLKPFNLPTYSVPFITNSKGESLTINPQVSYFQSPLLEIAPDIMQQLQKQNQDQKAQMKFLNSFTPLINQYLLPSIYNFLPKGCLPHHNYSNHPFFKQLQDSHQDEQPIDKQQQNQNQSLKQTEFQLDGQPIPAPGPNQNHNNRRKFSYVDDNFLLLGLRQYGYKEVDLIRDNWLPNKTTNEIKHRYKNLTCAKAPDNIIKRWKVTHNIPLSENEEKQLAKGIKWFGANSNRWALISRCFIPNRSSHFLKMEYQNIVSDHSRAERFGQLMLSDDEDDDKNFEDIDLDQFDKKKRSSSLSRSMGYDYDDENMDQEFKDQEMYEEEDFEEMELQVNKKKGQRNKAKNRSNSQKYDSNDEEEKEGGIKDDQLGDLQNLLASFIGSKSSSDNNKQSSDKQQNLKLLLKSLRNKGLVDSQVTQVQQNTFLSSSNQPNQQHKSSTFNKSTTIPSSQQQQLQQQLNKLDEISIYDESEIYVDGKSGQSIFQYITQNQRQREENEIFSSEQYDLIEL